METKTRNTILGVVLAFALVGVGIVAGKFIYSEKDVREEITSETSTTTSSQKSSSKSTTQGAAQDPLASCISSVNAEIKKSTMTIEPGTILVSFTAETSFAEGLAILDSFGLKPHNSASSQSDFASNHWLSVTVAKGNEAKQICILRGKPGIKYAGPNYTFKLAE